VENELLAFVACHGVTDLPLHEKPLTATTPGASRQVPTVTVDIEEDGGVQKERLSAGTVFGSVAAKRFRSFLVPA
jgi:hypothetical protein